jgi:pimeloyl-ACP methyl ester carboxylesterase
VSVLVLDAVTLRYEERGSGFPLLLLAPGGMNSVVEAWERAPFDPLETYADEFHLVAMDQRNAGASRGPLDSADPWGAYAADQLRLLDHLGLATVHVIGMCIGCAFGLRLAVQAPERVAAAVLLQPIGLLPENRELFAEMWRTWGAALAAEREDVDPVAVADFGRAMWDDEGFVGSVSRDEVRSLETPLLVLPGVDLGHPASIAREVARLAPRAELWEPWRDTPEQVAATVRRVRDFLRAHTPQG